MEENSKQTKCYCGHTTYCDCGPEEPKQEKMYSEEEVIQLIQFLSMSEEFNEYSSVSKKTANYFMRQFKKK